jgi:hypothetical protein
MTLVRAVVAAAAAKSPARLARPNKIRPLIASFVSYGPCAPDQASGAHFAPVGGEAVARRPTSGTFLKAQHLARLSRLAKLIAVLTRKIIYGFDGVGC